MSRELRSQLVVMAAKHAEISSHIALFYERGQSHPDYNRLCLSESLERFKKDIVLAVPFTDPTGRRISVKVEHFVKLVNMKRASGGERGKAGKLITSIEKKEVQHQQNTFSDGVYRWERDRIETLFWLPDLLTDPDAIYRNGHKIIQGERVFVKVYDKLGSKVKLAFTQKFGSGPEIVVTSFLTNPNDASSYIRGFPLYKRNAKPIERIAAEALKP